MNWLKALLERYIHTALPDVEEILFPDEGARHAHTETLRALVWIARVEPEHATSIHEAFALLNKHVSSEGHWDWIKVLYAE